MASTVAEQFIHLIALFCVGIKNIRDSNHAVVLLQTGIIHWAASKATLDTAKHLDGGISKIIHQSWRSEEVPEKFQSWAQTWRTNHPDWSYVLWTDESNRNLVAEHFPHLLPVYDAFPEVSNALLSSSPGPTKPHSCACFPPEVYHEVPSEDEQVLSDDDQCCTIRTGPFAHTNHHTSPWLMRLLRARQHRGSRFTSVVGSVSRLLAFAHVQHDLKCFALRYVMALKDMWFLSAAMASLRLQY